MPPEAVPPEAVPPEGRAPMKRRLSLVGPAEELLGIAPPILERAARGCSVGDATHRGLLIPRLLSKDQDALTYQPMVLDAAAEFERLRARGVQVPAAPPAALE